VTDLLNNLNLQRKGMKCKYFVTVVLSIQFHFFGSVKIRFPGTPAMVDENPVVLSRRDDALEWIGNCTARSS
jgi:hypothetical protein